MEFERKESDSLPVYDIEQPDGTVARFDFSASGSEFGDLVFYVHGENRSFDEEQFNLHYPGETDVFIQLLTHILQTRPGYHVQADISRLQNEVERLTKNMTPSQGRENDERWSRADVYRMMEVNRSGMPMPYSGNDSGTSVFLVSPQESGVELAMVRDGDGEEKLRHAVFVPSEQIWKLLAGVMWRTFSDPTHAAARSRTSTEVYELILEQIDQLV